MGECNGAATRDGAIRRAASANVWIGPWRAVKCDCKRKEFSGIAAIASHGLA